MRWRMKMNDGASTAATKARAANRRPWPPTTPAARRHNHEDRDPASAEDQTAHLARSGVQYGQRRQGEKADRKHGAMIGEARVHQRAPDRLRRESPSLQYVHRVLNDGLQAAHAYFVAGLQWPGLVPGEVNDCQQHEQSGPAPTNGARRTAESLV